MSVHAVLVKLIMLKGPALLAFIIANLPVIIVALGISGIWALANPEKVKELAKKYLN